ncbi:MAG: DNA polymerase III subunit beta [Sideroxydans sp.]|nr:DNA polymerase III subunit beta [Sideroxydans sp.]
MFIKQIDKNELLKPLQAVVGIVERKQPLPILSNVYIKKTKDGIKFISTDLEIQIEALLKTEMDGEEKSITISAKKLQEILRAIPDNSFVSLDDQQNRLLVKANKSKFSLQTLPAQDFPMLAEQLIEATKLEIEQRILRRLLSSVQYAMAQQDIRYYLNGVLLVIDGTSIKLIATDGHRLAYISEELFESHSKKEIILSRKTVNELLKLLSDTEEKVYLELAEKQVRISFADVVLTSKVIDGKFPDYNRVIPTHTNHLTLDRITILQALQRASILSNEKFRGVRLLLTEKNLRIISSNSEQEEAQEDIENDYQGVPLDIGFNVNYLLDGINNINSQNITLSFGDQNSSLLVTIPEKFDYKYVVMPMRI